MSSVVGIVLAAGMGTRMRSQTVKVLHPLGGKPMLTYPIEALKQAGADRIIVVVGHQAQRVQEEVKAQVPYDIDFVTQTEQLGTAHAVRQAAPLLKGFDGDVLVTYGDTPLYRSTSYETFIEEHRAAKAAATVLSTFVDEPYGYGRIVRDDEGHFDSIVEQRDITSEHIESIQEINTGTYCFSAPELLHSLPRVTNDNNQGEYYLPDVLTILRSEGKGVRVFVLDDAVEALGINDRRQLADAEQVLKNRVLARLMEAGVTVVDPQNTYVHPEVVVGADTIIYPFSSLEGASRVGEGCRIGPHTRIVDSHVGDFAKIEGSHVTRSSVESGAVIGPFTHLDGDRR